MHNMRLHLNDYSLCNHSYSYFSVPCGLYYPTSLAIFYVAAILVWLLACHVALSYFKELLLLSADNLCVMLPPMKQKSKKLTQSDLGRLSLKETWCFQRYLLSRSLCMWIEDTVEPTFSHIGFRNPVYETSKTTCRGWCRGSPMHLNRV